MESAGILYGDYDGKGNRLVVRTGDFSNLLYTVDGYLIGFSKSNQNNVNIDYFHFEKADFKKDETEKINAGFYSLEDWLEYWADKKKLSEIKKFEYINFRFVQENDIVVVEIQNTDYNTPKYNQIKKYEYTWDLPNQYLIANVPAGILIVPILQDYTPNITATSFFDNNKYLISQFASIDTKQKIAKNLVYAAYCMHHICNSIFPLFTSSEHQALIQEQKNYWTNPFSSNVSSLSEIELLNITKDFYLEVLNFYITGFRNKIRIEDAVGDKKFFFLSLFMSVKSLTTLTASIKLTILKSCASEMSRFFERDAVENLIVRVTSAFDANTLGQIDDFLDGLISENNEIKTGKESINLYRYIYDRMSKSWSLTVGLIQLSNWVIETDFKPTDTKGAFVQALYILWQFSKYNPYDDIGEIKQNVIGFKILDTSNNPKISYNVIGDNGINKLFYYSHESASELISYSSNNIDYFYYDLIFSNASPIVIPYNVEKKVGLYLNKFTFQFENNKIAVFEEYEGTFESDNSPAIESSSHALYGTYEIFQPVSLLNTKIDSVVPILTTTGNPAEINGLTLNSFIPIFVLKYYDDSNDRSNTETMLGYTVDGVLTFSGIGNLTKLRHLRWAALGATEFGIFTKQGLRVLLGGLEFSAGAVGYLANFIDCNANDEFCKNFKNFVMAFQLATLSLTVGDNLATFAMRKSAKGMVKATGKTTEAEIIAEIKSRLSAMNGNNSNTTVLDELSNNIYSFVVPLPIGLIKLIINKIKKAFDKVSWDLHPSYTDAFLTDYIKLCREELNLLDEDIIDLVVIANKQGKDGIKFIPPNELIKQTVFCIKEIKIRGYTAGFNDLIQYKQFCNVVKNQFIQNIDNLAGELSSHIGSLDIVVKGSAVRTLREGDPLVSLSGAAIPVKRADDIDMAFRLDPTDYDNFVEELKMVAIDILPTADADILIKKINKTDGKLQYDEIMEYFPIGNSDFTKKIKEAAGSHTNFYSDKIGFAIIKKGGKYDKKPEISFKY